MTIRHKVVEYSEIQKPFEGTPVIYSAYECVEGGAAEGFMFPCGDNRGYVITDGVAIFVHNELMGNGKFVCSPTIKAPTNQDAALAAAPLMIEAEDLHHCFFEGVRKMSDLGVQKLYHATDADKAQLREMRAAGIEIYELVLGS